MTGNPRPEANARPEVGSNTARAQPGSVPVLSDPPTNSELPTNENLEPVGIIYIDQSDGKVKATVPNGSGGVATGTLVDLSGSVSLGSGDTTGLL